MVLENKLGINNSNELLILLEKEMVEVQEYG